MTHASLLQACHFAAGAKLAASIVLRRRADGQVFAIDADKAASGEAANNNYVLTNLGKSMEKMLTASPEEFAKYHRNESHKISEEERNKREAYFYSKVRDFLWVSSTPPREPN